MPISLKDSDECRVLRILNFLFTKKMSSSDAGFCIYNEAQVSETLLQPIKLCDEVSLPWLGR